MQKRLIILFTLSLSLFALAQNSVEERRAREHAAVKNFINRISSQPINYVVPVDEKKSANNVFYKTTGQKDRKTYLMNGNRVITAVYNYGGIAPGPDRIVNVNNGVWRGSSYIFQFCPLFAGSVIDNNDPNKRLHIVSDGLWDYPAYREVNPTGDTLWSFQPLPGYADPDQGLIASNPAADKNKDGKPDSWPSSWYNPTLGKYVWPGYLEQDATNADLEIYWAMDDRDNREFNYFPFPAEPQRRGLGLQADARALQWSNTLAENSIFFVYTTTNVSEKNIDSIYFGLYGDCDVGGASSEVSDDYGLFVPPYNYDGNHNVSNIPVYARSIAYMWDHDGKGYLGVSLGYVGCKFLESPGDPTDNVDNDGDGMTDERQDDGIDNDGDWNPNVDDVGIDGIANTLDEGEGDGLPTAGKKLPGGARDPLFPGEPNFELIDLDESDQLGLTSFNSWTWSTEKVSNDESIYNRLRPGNFGEIQQNSDITFVFGSGPISLAAAEIKTVSMAITFGEDLDDLLISAETVQRIYNANYRFYKPPAKPNVVAVPGDKKVTLFWDTKAEESKDPLTGKDFEGYVIYRSTDPAFGDIQKITDGKGSAFFSTPLKDFEGNEARWDVDYRDEPFQDLNYNAKYDIGEPYTDINLDGKWTANAKDWWKGYHNVTFAGRGIQYFLGNNRGLVHTFVDSNKVINGQTYYYAVVAYDHGDSVGVPPTETTKKITIDPITSEIEFDVNTVMVTPGPRAAGYVEPDAEKIVLQRVDGISNAPITLKILDDLAVEDGMEYQLKFSDSMIVNNVLEAKKNYSILRIAEVADEVEFIGTNYTKMKYSGIDKNYTVALKSASGTSYNEGSDFIVDYPRGLIRRTAGTTIPETGKYSVTYRYYPLYESALLNNEDANPAFGGVKIYVKDYSEISIDTARTKWVEGNTNYLFRIDLGSVGSKKAKFPAEYEVRFSTDKIDSAVVLVAGQLKPIKVNYSVKDVTTGVPVRIPTYLKENLVTRDSAWTSGEEIIFFTPTSNSTTNDTITWGLVIYKNPDTSVTAVAPTTGDLLYVGTNRPLTSKDAFSFKTNAGTFSAQNAKSALDNIYVVPNPYVGYNLLEPTSKLPGTTRGERRIYFENLPQKCTIRIFTLSGELVQTLEHETTFQNAREYWNLLNNDGFSVAYGIYFAHIDAPGIGEKIIKFALIK